MDNYDTEISYLPLPSTPVIRAMGYLDSNLIFSYGGSLKIFAQFYDNEATSISKVDVYHSDILLVSLNNGGENGDFVSGDSFFTFTMEIIGELPKEDFLFDLVGVTKDGVKTSVAPYLIVK